MTAAAPGCQGEERAGGAERRELDPGWAGPAAGGPGESDPSGAPGTGFREKGESRRIHGPT